MNAFLIVATVVVGDPTAAAVADVLLGEQVVDQRVDLCAVGGDRLGVVHDRLKAQNAFAFGVRLQRRMSEVDLEDREVPPRFLDHDCLLKRQLLAGFAVRAAFAADGLYISLR